MHAIISVAERGGARGIKTNKIAEDAIAGTRVDTDSITGIAEDNVGQSCIGPADYHVIGGVLKPDATAAVTNGGVSCCICPDEIAEDRVTGGVIHNDPYLRIAGND